MGLAALLAQVEWVGIIALAGALLASGYAFLTAPPEIHPTGKPLPTFASRLEALQQASQTILFSEDIHEAFAAASTVALQLSGARVALIYCFEREHNQYRLLFQQGHQTAYAEYWTLIPAPPSQEDGVFITLNSPQSTQAGSFNDQVCHLAQSDGWTHLLVVPLHTSSIRIGAIVLLFDQPSGESAAADQTLLSAIQIIGDQLAAYMDNTDLFDVLENYALQMAQLSHLARIATSAVEVDTLASEITLVLSELFDAPTVVLVINEDEGRWLRFYERTLLPDRTYNYSVSRELSSIIPEISQITLPPNALSRFCSHADTDISDGLRDFILKRRLLGITIFPLIAANIQDGFLLIGSSTGVPMDSAQIQILEMANSQIAVQIHNVGLYETTQIALKRRLDELALIEDIARQISTCLNFEQISEQLVIAALKATASDTALLALLTDGGKLWSVMQYDKSGEFHRSYRARGLRESLIEQITRTRQSFLIPDTYHVEGIGDILPGSRSVAAVPLERDGNVIGVLSVTSEQVHYFKNEQLSFLTSLAGHAVISIENARLLEEHEYQIATLRGLQALTMRLSSADNTRSVAEAVLETAQDMLKADEVALFKYNSDTQQIQMIHGYTRPGKTAQLASFSQNVLRTAQTGEIKMQDNVSGAGTIIQVPIKGSQGVSEVLAILFDETTKIRQRELNSLLLLASQTAGHLENAALHEQIRAASNRTSAILNSTRDGVILLDREGRLLECNPAAERLLNFDKEEFLNKHIVAMLLRLMESGSEGDFGYDRAGLTALARQLRLEPERITRREFSRATGSQMLYIEEIGSPVRNNTGEIVGRLLVFRDMTEQNLLSKYREEITHMMVHDLRGPLWSIITGIDLAISDLESANVPINENILKTLDIAKNSAVSLRNIVDSLLDISRLEKREMPLERAPTSVADLIQSAYDTLAIMLTDAALQIDLNIEDGLPMLDVDEALIRRVLINLLDNAARHTPDNGRILISAQRDGSDVKILVADSGVGIPPAEREHIFERFRQVKTNVPVRGSKGSGLGLTFCKLAVEAHGGRIWVEPNSPLNGACFSLRLPVVRVHEREQTLHA